MTYDEFLSYFNFPVTPKEYASAISSSIVSLCRGISYFQHASLPPLLNLSVAEFVCHLAKKKILRIYIYSFKKRFDYTC